MICVMYMSGTKAGQKASDPLEWQLQMVISHHVGRLKEQQVLLTSGSSLQPQVFVF